MDAKTLTLEEKKTRIGELIAEAGFSSYFNIFSTANIKDDDTADDILRMLEKWKEEDSQERTYAE
jgi:hypothetical protein